MEVNVKGKIELGCEQHPGILQKSWKESSELISPSYPYRSETRNAETLRDPSQGHGQKQNSYFLIP